MKKGFTLIELLAAIAILAVLTTIAVIGFTTIKDSSIQSNYDSKIEYAKVAAIRYGNDKKDTIWNIDPNLACQTKSFIELIQSGHLSSDSKDSDSYINPVTKREMDETLEIKICYANGKITVSIQEKK